MVPKLLIVPKEADVLCEGLAIPDIDSAAVYDCTEGLAVSDVDPAEVYDCIDGLAELLTDSVPVKHVLSVYKKEAEAD